MLIEATFKATKKIKLLFVLQKFFEEVFMQVCKIPLLSRSPSPSSPLPELIKFS